MHLIHLASWVHVGVQHVAEVILPVLPVRRVARRYARDHYGCADHLRDDRTPLRNPSLSLGTLNWPA